MRVRSGWPSKAMPNMSNTSRSMASVPGWTSNSVGTTGSDSGDLHPDAHALAGGVRDQGDDDLEALGGDAVGEVGLRMGEVVDRR